MSVFRARSLLESHATCLGLVSPAVSAAFQTCLLCAFFILSDEVLREFVGIHVLFCTVSNVPRSRMTKKVKMDVRYVTKPA